MTRRDRFDFAALGIMLVLALIIGTVGLSIGSKDVFAASFGIVIMGDLWLNMVYQVKKERTRKESR